MISTIEPSPKELVISPDGKHVYSTVSSFNNDSAAQFSRDQITGKLSQLNPCLVGPAFGWAYAIAISPNGDFVYIASSYEGERVNVFSRDSVSGQLTYTNTGIWTNGLKEIIISPDGLSLYILTGYTSIAYALDPITGVIGAQLAVNINFSGKALVVSPDNKYVYGSYSSVGGNQITVYNRDVLGNLTLAYEVLVNSNISGFGSGMIISPDGLFLYVLCASTILAGGGQSVISFNRNISTGNLSFLQEIPSNFNNSSNMQCIAITPDGLNLYVRTSSFFSQYDRNITTGLLTETLASITVGTGNSTADSIITSPDNKNVYVSNAAQNLIHEYGRPAPTATTTVTGARNFVTLTYVPTGLSQKLEVFNIKGVYGETFPYNFDKMGVQVNLQLGKPLDPTDVSGFTSISGADAAHTMAILGGGSGIDPVTLQNVAHGGYGSIYLRSTVDVSSTISFTQNNVHYTVLDEPINLTYGNNTLGWIAWNDPITNPNVGISPPQNQYEPVAGDWSLVEPYLHNLSEDIKARTSDTWSWFDGSDFTPYKSSWSSWSELKPTIIESRYRLLASDTLIDFNKKFTFAGLSVLDVQSRASVYLNEKKVLNSNWSVQLNGADPMVVLSVTLNQGDLVRVKLDAYTPTVNDLSFDPTISDLDPFKLTQYKLDYPFVTEVLRNENDARTITNYYYWVKNKTTPPAPNKASTKAITQMLSSNDKIYSVPQDLKYYNQLDGRPNRYTILSVKGLGQLVHAADRFKLRLSKDPTLRDRDQNLELKPVHTEWMLLRPGQVDLIPIELWNTLTDTLTGSTKLNQALPYSELSLYDQRNNSTVSFGMNEGQVMTSVANAIATVKHTILNTQVNKYMNDVLVSDYISYPGFDINQLDVYFSSTDNIRKFMTELWRFAKSTQVNEIFFAVLQDLASQNLELDKFFKTSFISLSDVKTVTVG